MSDGRRPGGGAARPTLLGGALLGAALVGAVLMTAGCGDADRAGPDRGAAPTGEWSTAGCALPRAPQSTGAGTARMLTTPATLDAAMARIEAGGRERFADSFAGLEVDQAGVRAIVYRVPSADFDDFVRLSAEDACVVVRDAAHALGELAAWRDRVVADLPRWSERGLRVTTVGARHDGAGVEIGTPDVKLAARELPSHYGREAPLIFVEQGPVAPLPGTGRPAAPPPGG